MTLYLDASVVVPLFVREPAHPIVLALLDRNPAPLIVTELAAGELASALSRLVRTRQLPLANAIDSLVAFDAWRVGTCLSPAFESVDIRTAALFVRRFELKLRMPDAIHAATARRLGATLVTFDLRLASAAAALGIACTVPT